MSINDSFVTSIVSGSLTFFVSGRRSVKIPATRAVEPRENIIPACLHEKKEFLVGLRGWVTGERSELSFLDL